jgi:hypothetical protein
MGEKVVLISCSGTQRLGIRRARDLYIGKDFKKCLEYAAEIVQADKIYILSTKHRLLTLDTKIAAYNVPFPEGIERVKWERGVLEQLRAVCDLEQDYFTLLPPAPFIEFIKSYIKHKEIPLDGLTQGKRLAWLDQHMYREMKRITP